MQASLEESPPDSELVGGRYRVLRLLGKGGMGSVHEVVDGTSGARLALKRLHVDTGGGDDRMLGLFEREYQTLASLRHPRIVRVFDYGVDAAGAYYTMELLEGRDLSRMAPLPWREACLCLRDAASILGVLHARRLVHRDLSPRNLWRTPDGRLKLLDFGALASFGPVVEVVGTPPLTAPEVVRGGDLDGRTDLFTLGALGYWLLTSTHAFPARKMGALEALWLQRPTAPSLLVELIKTADHSVPGALDELILSLLSLDPEERPQSTVAVVDELNAIADLEHESEAVVHSGYLDSVAFVGRFRELGRFESALARADRGKPAALSFEGPDGIGRSRLLAESALMARVAGATVIALDASAGDRPYGLAEHLVSGLAVALPAATREAAAPLAGRLACCTPQLARSLGLEAVADDGRTAAQVRADCLDALCSLVRRLAADRTLVLLVDDMDAVDEESQSMLAMLAHHGGTQSRLLLVATTATERLPQGLTAHGAYRHAARCREIPPLNEAEVRALLRSAFGEAPNLSRMAARLWTRADGRPGGVLTLVQHLVRSGEVTYREGAWVLPLDLPEGLPTTRQSDTLRLLAELSTEALELAADLSVPDYGPTSRRACQGLAGVDEHALGSLVDELAEKGVVRENEDGLEIRFPEVRAQLLGGLAEARRTEVHAILAGHLAEGDPAAFDMSRRVRIGMHWCRAGDTKQGQGHLVEALRSGMRAGRADEIRRAAPAFEDWLELLDAQGANDAHRAPALVALSVAGYLVEQSYAKRHGDETCRVLEGLLHLRWAHRLRRLLGGKLALVVALGVAGVGLKLRRAPMGLQELLHWFMSTLSALAGASAAVVDSAAVRRYTQALAPFGVMGMDHAAGLVPLFVRGLLGAVEDRPAQSLRDMQRVIDRLDEATPIEGLVGDTRAYTRAGAVYCNGVRLNLANRPGVLEAADEIERVGPVQALTAEFLRAAWYASMGELERAAKSRERLEVMAIQVGSGWQAECLAPMQDMRVAFWTWDPVAMKRAAQDVAMVASRRPSVGFFEPEARAMYALMRGRFEQARDLMRDDSTEPLSIIGWVRRRGVLAAAHNGLGEYAEARAVCVDALDRLEPDDLDYVQIVLDLQVEHARALFGLGEQPRAIAMVDGFLERFADRGPLVVAFLHRARFELALEQEDFDTCEHHLQAMADQVLDLRIASLRAVLAGARRALQRRRDPEDVPRTSDLFADDAHLMTRVQLVLTHAGESSEARTEAGLELAMQLTGSTSACVVSAESDDVAVKVGESPDSDVVLWAREQLASAMEEDETATVADSDVGTDNSVISLRGQQHRVSVLWRPGESMPVAALVLTAAGETPGLAPEGLRRALASHVWEVTTQGSDLA